MVTPKGWAENVEPTPEQWVGWFLSCTPEEQERTAARAITASREASECFMRHAGIEALVADYQMRLLGLQELLARRTADATA